MGGTLSLGILSVELGSTGDLFTPLQEKVDRKASSNPDLHLNRATVRPIGGGYLMVK